MAVLVVAGVADFLAGVDLTEESSSEDDSADEDALLGERARFSPASGAGHGFWSRFAGA